MWPFVYNAKIHLSFKVGENLLGGDTQGGGICMAIRLNEPPATTEQDDKEPRHTKIKLPSRAITNDFEIPSKFYCFYACAV